MISFRFNFHRATLTPAQRGACCGSQERRSWWSRCLEYHRTADPQTHWSGGPVGRERERTWIHLTVITRILTTLYTSRTCFWQESVAVGRKVSKLLHARLIIATDHLGILFNLLVPVVDSHLANIYHTTIFLKSYLYRIQGILTAEQNDWAADSA